MLFPQMSVKLASSFPSGVHLKGTFLQMLSLSTWPKFHPPKLFIPPPIFFLFLITLVITLCLIYLPTRIVHYLSLHQNISSMSPGTFVCFIHYPTVSVNSVYHLTAAPYRFHERMNEFMVGSFPIRGLSLNGNFWPKWIRRGEKTEWKIYSRCVSFQDPHLILSLLKCLDSM